MSGPTEQPDQPADGLSVVLAGGGTAGHTSPLIATAQALHRIDPGITLTCIGTARGLETSVIPAAGLDLRLIPAVPLPRQLDPDLFKVPVRLLGAVRAAEQILTEVDADVLVGFGGYVSMPAYLAARRLSVPVVLHEQNQVPGIANKVAARFARRVLTAFPGTGLAAEQVVGLPVRAELSELADRGRQSSRAEARQLWGLDPEAPLLLVSGGSQGARSLNEATLGAVPGLLAAGIQILHVWGTRNYPEDIRVMTDPASGVGYHPLAFVDRMELAYAAADLMLARSGAATVVEIAMLGLPAILVPLPHGNGEQARNAEPLIRAGAALVVPDAQLTAGWLTDRVIALLGNTARLDQMGLAGRSLMPAGAADRVARIVLTTAAERPVRRRLLRFGRRGDGD